MERHCNGKDTVTVNSAPLPAPTRSAKFSRPCIKILPWCCCLAYSSRCQRSLVSSFSSLFQCLNLPNMEAHLKVRPRWSKVGSIPMTVPARQNDVFHALTFHCRKSKWVMEQKADAESVAYTMHARSDAGQRQVLSGKSAPHARR